MALQRADRLKEPPVIGRWYLVPAIFWNRDAPWTGGRKPEDEILIALRKGAKWWPVWGIKHNDAEHFNFKLPHYHIDPRFLTKRHMADVRGNSNWYATTLQAVRASPLNHIGLKDGPPKPQLRRMRCGMSHAEWGHAESKPVASLNAAFAGKQCAKGKRGLVCPHRHFPLGSIEAIDGVVTCPLHGMRINAETGECLGSAT